MFKLNNEFGCPMLHILIVFQFYKFEGHISPMRFHIRWKMEHCFCNGRKSYIYSRK
jgi:hypothetical protein